MLNLEKVNIEQLIFLSEKLTGKPVKFRRGPATVNGEFFAVATEETWEGGNKRGT